MTINLSRVSETITAAGCKTAICETVFKRQADYIVFSSDQNKSTIKHGVNISPSHCDLSNAIAITTVHQESLHASKLSMVIKRTTVQRD